MKYFVEGEDEPFYSIDDVLDYCIEDDYHEDDDYFEEWINDNYEKISINGVDYWAYDILNEMDSSNLYDLRKDYCMNENENDRDNGRFELERADNGEEIYIQRYVVTVVDEEEEEESSDGCLENTRRLLEEQKADYDKQAAENKKTEDDIMTMFQVIS